jgi:hypothetical protein
MSYFQGGVSSNAHLFDIGIDNNNEPPKCYYINREELCEYNRIFTTSYTFRACQKTKENNINLGDVTIHNVEDNKNTKDSSLSDDCVSIFGSDREDIRKFGFKIITAFEKFGFCPVRISPTTGRVSIPPFSEWRFVKIVDKYTEELYYLLPGPSSTRFFTKKLRNAIDLTVVILVRENDEPVVPVSFNNYFCKIVSNVATIFDKIRDLEYLKMTRRTIEERLRNPNLFTRIDNPTAAIDPRMNTTMAAALRFNNAQNISQSLNTNTSTSSSFNNNVDNFRLQDATTRIQNAQIVNQNEEIADQQGEYTWTKSAELTNRLLEEQQCLNFNIPLPSSIPSNLVGNYAGMHFIPLKANEHVEEVTKVVQSTSKILEEEEDVKKAIYAITGVPSSTIDTSTQRVQQNDTAHNVHLRGTIKAMCLEMTNVVNIIHNLSLDMMMHNNLEKKRDELFDFLREGRNPSDEFLDLLRIIDDIKKDTKATHEEKKIKIDCEITNKAMQNLEKNRHTRIIINPSTIISLGELQVAFGNEWILAKHCAEMFGGARSIPRGMIEQNPPPASKILGRDKQNASGGGSDAPKNPAGEQYSKDLDGN